MTNGSPAEGSLTTPPAARGAGLLLVSGTRRSCAGDVRSQRDWGPWRKQKYHKTAHEDAGPSEEAVVHTH